MKISILGSGMVGQTIAQKTNELGHSVFMGTRDPEETKSRTEPNRMTGISFSDWYKNNRNVEVVAYADLPSDTSLFINATNGQGSIPALTAAGSILNGKTILDISNPLDFSKGFPPSLYVSNTDSLGEQIQREFPNSNVVKGLNTMNCFIMMNPSLIPGDHSVFLSGNKDEAKKEVKTFLTSLGWKEKNIIDLGDITTARGPEMILPLWLRLLGALGTAEFNFNVVKK